MPFRLTSVAALLVLALAALAPAASSQAQPGGAIAPAADILVEGVLPDFWLGSPKAPVTIIEYASMTCPHCANFHLNVFADLKAQYIDTGIVRFVIREFPLDPYAAAGFALARCSADATGLGPDAYYEVIDTLFRDQAAWAGNLEGFTAQVIAAGFTIATFETCYDGVIEGIIAAYDRGLAFGVDATPTFFINGEQHVGVLSLAEIAVVIARYVRR